MADDSSGLNQILSETSFLYGGNGAFVEELYAKWVSDPASVAAMNPRGWVPQLHYSNSND